MDNSLSNKERGHWAALLLNAGWPENYLIGN